MVFSFMYYMLFFEFCNAGNENELTFCRILSGNLIPLSSGFADL